MRNTENRDCTPWNICPSNLDSLGTKGNVHPWPSSPQMGYLRAEQITSSPTSNATKPPNWALRAPCPLFGVWLIPNKLSAVTIRGENLLSTPPLTCGEQGCSHLPTSRSKVYTLKNVQDNQRSGHGCLIGTSEWSY